MTAFTEIHDKMHALRDDVTSAASLVHPVRNKRKWLQLCSSMDAIEDTALALEAFGKPGEEDAGVLYLRIYGALQALFVQQDAISNAAEALGMDYSRPEDIQAIRNLRNCAVGHPTKRNGGEARSFGIVRISMTQRGFELHALGAETELPSGPVDIRALIDTQEEHAESAVQRMTEHVRTTNWSP